MIDVADLNAIREFLIRIFARGDGENQLIRLVQILDTEIEQLERAKNAR